MNQRTDSCLLPVFLAHCNLRTTSNSCSYLQIVQSLCYILSSLSRWLSNSARSMRNAERQRSSVSVDLPRISSPAWALQAKKAWSGVSAECHQMCRAPPERWNLVAGEVHRDPLARFSSNAGNVNMFVTGSEQQEEAPWRTKGPSKCIHMVNWSPWISLSRKLMLP